MYVFFVRSEQFLNKRPREVYLCVSQFVAWNQRNKPKYMCFWHLFIISPLYQVNRPTLSGFFRISVFSVSMSGGIIDAPVDIMDVRLHFTWDLVYLMCFQLQEDILMHLAFWWKPLPIYYHLLFIQLQEYNIRIFVVMFS